VEIREIILRSCIKAGILPKKTRVDKLLEEFEKIGEEEKKQVIENFEEFLNSETEDE